MAIVASTQLGAGSPDDRWSPGFKKTAGTANLYGGMVVQQDNTDASGKTIKAGTGVVDSTDLFPIGLVIEPTSPNNVIAAQGDGAAGAGFDTVFYARGGVYSVFHRPGNTFDVFDDNINTSAITVTRNGGTAPSGSTSGGTLNQQTSCPFVADDTFHLGDILYASATGLLTNTPPASGTIYQIGRVMAVSGSGATQRITVQLNTRIA